MLIPDGACVAIASELRAARMDGAVDGSVTRSRIPRGSLEHVDSGSSEGAVLSVVEGDRYYAAGESQVHVDRRALQRAENKED